LRLCRHENSIAGGGGSVAVIMAWAWMKRKQANDFADECGAAEAVFASRVSGSV